MGGGGGRPRPPKRITGPYLERVGLHYMQRHGGSSGQLRRILDKRVRRSIEHHGQPTFEEASQLVDALIQKFERLGYVDDRRYTENRAAALVRRGKSSRAIQAELRRVGIPRRLIDELVQVDDLAAARAYVRRRRLAGGQKDLAKLARAGFSYDVAKRALREPEA